MTQLRISVKNTADVGGTFLTPFWFGIHSQGFDLFNAGQTATPGLEALAEDGNFAPINGELMAADADAQSGAVLGAAGPIATGEMAAVRVDVDGSNTHISLGAMVLPSNDAFVGTDRSIKLFDAHGNFKGAKTIKFDGGDVYDAGTEVNTEMDAAFINQTGPNTGMDENGVVGQHPGFNGSMANPTGDQIILGGTNAFGVEIDPAAADFTRPGAQIAKVHINTVKERDGSNKRDFIWGGRDDDMIDAKAGNDFVFGGSGWDVIDGGAGHDKLFGGSGDDQIMGGIGRDIVKGGSGDDVVAGGTGRDHLFGGRGEDVFVFSEDDGRDTVWDFNAHQDKVLLDVDGITDFTDISEHAQQVGRSVKIDFGEGDILMLWRTKLSDLTEDSFMIV